MIVTVISGPDLKRVTQLNGQAIEVQGETEQRYYNAQKRKYTTENRFTTATDLADLDRLLFLELLVFRWTTWLSSGKDYDGFLPPSQEEQIRKNLASTAPLISQIKSDLGMTRLAREKEQHDSVGAYITELKRRAKEHGVHRETQLARALALANELFSLVGTFQRSSPHEREKLGLGSAEDILDWVENHMRPQYEEVDEHFRAHSQKFWVGSL